MLSSEKKSTTNSIKQAPSLEAQPDSACWLVVCVRHRAALRCNV